MAKTENQWRWEQEVSDLSRGAMSVSSSPQLSQDPEIHGSSAGLPLRHELRWECWQKRKSRAGCVPGPGTLRTQCWHSWTRSSAQSPRAHFLTSLRPVSIRGPETLPPPQLNSLPPHLHSLSLPNPVCSSQHLLTADTSNVTSWLYCYPVMQH